MHRVLTQTRAFTNPLQICKQHQPTTVKFNTPAQIRHIKNRCKAWKHHKLLKDRIYWMAIILDCIWLYRSPINCSFVLKRAKFHNSLHGRMCVAGRKNLQPAELLSLGSFVANAAPKLRSEIQFSGLSFILLDVGTETLCCCYCCCLFLLVGQARASGSLILHCWVCGFFKLCIWIQNGLQRFCCLLPTWQDN